MCFVEKGRWQAKIFFSTEHIKTTIICIVFLNRNMYIQYMYNICTAYIYIPSECVVYGYNENMLSKIGNRVLKNYSKRQTSESV